MKIKFETDPCARCGGCGEYSYNQLTGSRCFKCNGSGKQLTRNGRARRREYDRRIEKASSISAFLVKPGDAVKVAFSPSRAPSWHRVHGVELDTLNSCRFVNLSLMGGGYATGGTVLRHPGSERVREIMRSVARRKGAEVTG